MKRKFNKTELFTKTLSTVLSCLCHS